MFSIIILAYGPRLHPDSISTYSQLLFLQVGLATGCKQKFYFLKSIFLFTNLFP
ncbi:hypothetical protein CPK_ORF00571 [Chlamydia pneumoniae LPCoLN]|nr:hypothetical protein CPK_ORF00571 [Chlamydia pneumoniae LPCoLN]ETR79931.1 hypothetical protein X556_0732 [Chlamydia pneumoniae B21]